MFFIHWIFTRLLVGSFFTVYGRIPVRVHDVISAQVLQGGGGVLK